MKREEKIVVSYCNTYDVAKTAGLRTTQVLTSRLLRNVETGVLIWLAIALIVANAIALSHGPISNVHIILLVCSILAVAWMWFQTTKLWDRMLLATFMKPFFHWLPSSNRVVVLTIDNEAIEAIVQGHGRHYKMWRGLLKVVRTPEGFILWPPKHWSLVWIPLEAFESEQDVETFVHLARSNVAKYIELPQRS